MHIKDDNRRNFAPTTALFIWLCHIVIAIFFYNRAITWGVTAYYWGSLFFLVASIPYVIAFLAKKFILYEPLYLFLGAFLISHTACMFLNFDDIGLDLGL